MGVIYEMENRTSLQEIVDAVKNIGDIEKKYEEKYNRFCEKYCAWEDGHATEKVVNAVFDCE